MDELRTRHRKEQRELQGRITQKKKNATKKTRKGVNDECERLERELHERQTAELNELNGDIVTDGIQQKLHLDEGDQAVADKSKQEEDGVKRVTFDPTMIQEEEDDSSQQSQQPRKQNRQKARLARRAAEQEAQATAAAEEAANLPDLREQETTSMKAHMERLGLEEKYIRPDGHCLYSACASGISAEDVRKSGPYTEAYQNVRYVTADFISKHPDDFSAFLEEPLDVYVKKIENTAEWGGQLELQAIARAFKVHINVLQSDGRVEKILPEEGENMERQVWLAYYRHSFGLGEHYNALLKKTAS